ncbi:MAG: acyltransferase [Pseudomonadota bacterium]
MSVPLPKHLPSIDGLRALAIILVLVSHIPYTAGYALPEYKRYLIPLGSLGVRVFFVISGFLITYLLLREHKERGSIGIRSFYIRRVFRLLPVYYVYLLVVFILQMTIGIRETTGSWFGSITYMRNMFGNGDSLTVHFWSLSVEEQFYVFMPFIVVLCLMSKHYLKLLGAVFASFLVIGLVARTVPCASESFVCERLMAPRSILKYIDSLGVGCLLAVLFFSGVVKVQKRLWGIEFILMAAIIGTPYVLWPYEIKAPIQLIQAVLIASLIVYCLSSTSALYGVMNSSPAIWIGRLSYSLYVWHMLFIVHFYGDVAPDIWLMDWKFWLIPSVACACASYFFLEKPLRKVGHRLSKRLTSQIDEAAQQAPEPVRS